MAFHHAISGNDFLTNYFNIKQLIYLNQIATDHSFNILVDFLTGSAIPLPLFTSANLQNCWDADSKG